MKKKAPTSPTDDRVVPIALRDDGGLRLVLVADTHGKPHPDSARHIAARRPDAILHAGDIGDLGVLDELSKLAPVVAVRGNIDARVPGVPDVVAIEIQSPDRCVMRLLLVHIAVYGTKLRSEVWRRAVAEKADMVICGHSHLPFAGRDRGVMVFNPGSIGPRRFGLPIVFGVFEVASGKASLTHVDCETGLDWTP